MKNMLKENPRYFITPPFIRNPGTRFLKNLCTKRARLVTSGTHWRNPPMKQDSNYLAGRTTKLSVYPTGAIRF